ncbi:MAG TPA: hypothetical protein PLV68_17910, partial [Ilumatobacteraceae bacterium]|nr:hypothetical protein [Ilumatobacteraceae bacterium]
MSAPALDAVSVLVQAIDGFSVRQSVRCLSVAEAVGVAEGWVSPRWSQVSLTAEGMRGWFAVRHLVADGDGVRDSGWRGWGPDGRFLGE